MFAKTKFPLRSVERGQISSGNSKYHHIILEVNQDQICLQFSEKKKAQINMALGPRRTRSGFARSQLWRLNGVFMLHSSNSLKEIQLNKTYRRCLGVLKNV